MAALFGNTPRDVLLLVFIAISFCDASSNLQYGHGVLDAKNTAAHERVCVTYYPKLSSYPTENEVYAPLLDLSDLWYACNDIMTDELAAEVTAVIKGSIVLVSQKGNCTIIEKAQTVERFGGKGMIMVVSEKLMDLPATDTYPALVPIALLWQDSKNIIKELGSSVEVVITSPIPKPSFNYSWIAIVIFAVLAVGIGSYWSGLEQHLLRQEKAKIANETEVEGLSFSGPLVFFVIALIFVICGIVFFLYLFISYTVHFTIGIYVLASSFSFYCCLEKIFDRFYIGTLKFGKFQVKINKFLLFIAAMVLVSCWTVYRKDSFAWILSDILSFSLSVTVIRVLSFHSLKAGTIWIALLFIFEGCLVFVLLLFPSKKEVIGGIVEAVADGNSSGSYAELASVALTINEMLIQRLPMYIRFPLFGTDLLSVCRLQQQYTSLGLENIFIPGFLIGFCHSFDLARGHGSKIYYTTTFVAYGVGLLSSIACFFLMATPQLIHLYLIPFTLTVIFFIGLCRREIKLLWKGGELVTLPIVEKKRPSVLVPPNPSESKWSLPSSAVSHFK